MQTFDEFDQVHVRLQHFAMTNFLERWGFRSGSSELSYVRNGRRVAWLAALLGAMALCTLMYLGHLARDTSAHNHTLAHWLFVVFGAVLFIALSLGGIYSIYLKHIRLDTKRPLNLSQAAIVNFSLGALFTIFIEEFVRHFFLNR